MVFFLSGVGGTGGPCGTRSAASRTPSGRGASGSSDGRPWVDVFPFYDEAPMLRSLQRMGSTPTAGDYARTLGYASVVALSKAARGSAAKTIPS